MSRAIHQVPPAPRQIRWPAILWHRWLLALCALLFFVYGGLWTLMLFYHSGGKPRDDARLDARQTLTAGLVTGVQASPAVFDGRPQERITYRFATDTSQEEGKCFFEAGALEPGHRVEVNYLPVYPHVNRVVGGRIYLLPNYLAPAIWLLVLPGLAFLLSWLYGCLRLRRVLTRGVVGVGDVLQVKPVPWLLPSMLDVRFAFRDHHAQLRTSGHWIRERSPLGQQLLGGETRIAVVHDRDRPERARLVLPEEFFHYLRRDPAHS